jgi:hypothetical protein
MAELKPEARILLQSRRTGEIVQLDSFTNISTTVGLDSGGASISFTNINDRAFAKVASRDRDLPQSVKAYLKEIFDLKLVAEINAMRRSIANDLHAGRVTSRTMDEFLRTEWVSEIEFMNRIWIDFRGRDGQWRAGFTGVTSGVSDDFRVGGVPSVSVSCNDMRRLLQISQIITLGGDNGMLFTTEQDLKAQERIPNAFKTVQNIFSNIDDPAGVISRALDLVNAFFGGQASGLGRFPSLFGSNSLWNIQGLVDSPTRNYDGVVPIRSEDVFARLSAFASSQVARLDGMQRPDIVLSNNPPFAQTAPDVVQGYGLAAYLVDKSISSENLKPLRTGLRASFEVLGVERTSAERIIAEVLSVTHYDFWCDAMGNAIFQRPRYDDLPNFQPVDYEKKSDRGIAFDPVSRTFLPSGEMSAQGVSGLRDHGRNYLIGDESLKRMTTSSSESGLYTVATVSSSFDFIDQGELLRKLGQTGVALAPAKLQRLLGTRIFSGKAPVSAAVNIEKAYLNRAAAALLRRLNAQAVTMSAELVQRPDLQPGRTVLAVERQKLYYLREVTNDFAVGEEHTTTIRCNYGHLPEEPVGDPWLMPENFEAVIAFAKNLADVSEETNQKVLAAAYNLDPSFLTPDRVVPGRSTPR